MNVTFCLILPFIDFLLQIRDLKVSLLALEIGDLALTFVPFVGFFSSLALTAAQIALELAADSLEKEVVKMTEDYFDGLHELGESKLYFSQIDIDVETIERLKKMFAQYKLIMASSEVNKGHNIPLWNKICINMSVLKSRLEVTQEVLAEGLIEYAKIDFQSLDQTWKQVHLAATNIR